MHVCIQLVKMKVIFKYIHEDIIRKLIASLRQTLVYAAAFEKNISEI